MKLAGIASTLILAASASYAAPVVRYPLLGGSKFPIARAVEVPPGATLIFHSGTMPSPADANAEKYSAAYWGDTKAQALSAFANIKASLDTLGLTFGDVVSMTVYLAAPPDAKSMDFAGFMEGYTTYFGTPEQPNLPARSTVQVAGLASPGALVEIEVTLVKKTPMPKHKKPAPVKPAA